eukprot:scaffold113591_cov55-Phaeocystis_antarctica.AAC.2
MATAPSSPPAAPEAASSIWRAIRPSNPRVVSRHAACGGSGNNHGTVLHTNSPGSTSCGTLALATPRVPHAQAHGPG